MMPEMLFFLCATKAHSACKITHVNTSTITDERQNCDGRVPSSIAHVVPPRTSMDF